MRKVHAFLITLLASAAAAPAAADDLDGLDGLEMDVLDVEVTPHEAATRILVLPEAPPPAQVGLEQANTAEEGGAAIGESTAEAAGEVVSEPPPAGERVRRTDRPQPPERPDRPRHEDQDRERPDREDRGADRERRERDAKPNPEGGD